MATLYRPFKQRNMKKTIIFLSVLCLTANAFSTKKSTHKKTNKMKLNAGIITTQLAESKAFYSQYLGFGVSFENEFYLLMHTPNHEAEISFLLPNHPTQQALFHAPFCGKGMYFTIEVEDVDSLYQQLKKQGVPIKIEIRNEPWGDRHFAIEDPNGIGIDLVKYSPPQDR
jgi:catechol 2,3-dioxygenase-like lactoylglutathione lyase family enzyme